MFLYPCEDAHASSPFMGLQAEFSQAGSLIGTEKGSRSGTERLSQTEDDRADQQLDDAVSIGGLPLLTCGLVHINKF